MPSLRPSIDNNTSERRNVGRRQPLSTNADHSSAGRMPTTNPPNPNTISAKNTPIMTNVPDVFDTACHVVRGNAPAYLGSNVSSMVPRLVRKSHDSSRKKTATLIADQLKNATPTTGTE